MNNKNLSTSSAIIIAAVIIGLGLYFGLGSTSAPTELTTKEISRSIKVERNDSTDLETKVTIDDHIIGNFETAEVFVIEYSDLECPYCKNYRDIEGAAALAQFGDDERVAFVFRHFPLGKPLTGGDLHPTSVEEAVISECVAMLEGEEKFVSFVNSIFEETSSDGRYDLPYLLTQAQDLGVEKDALEECYTGSEAATTVARQFQQGVLMGVQGTPTLFVQTKDGEVSLVNRSKNENVLDKVSSYLK